MNSACENSVNHRPGDKANIAAGFSTVDTAEQAAVEGGNMGILLGAAIGLAIVYVAYKAAQGYLDAQDQTCPAV